MFFSTYLRIGIIFASFKDSGIMPLKKDILNSNASG